MRKLILFLLLSSTTVFAQQFNLKTITTSGPYIALSTGGADTTFNITLTGNVTSASLDGGSTQAMINIILCQDAVGNHTFSFPANIFNPPIVSPTASSCTAGQFVNIGSGNWQNTLLGPVGGPPSTNVIYANAPKYNLPATGYTSCNGTLANGSNVVQTNVNDPPFTAAMVGWIIMANSQTCQTFDNSGVNRFPTNSTTITGFTDAHHVTVSSNANGSCVNTTPSCQIGWFPADSQPALQAAWNDALATGICAQLIVPVGYYAIGSAITNSTNPAPCGLVVTFGVSSDSQSAGVSGQGMYSTRFVPLPSFNGSTCSTVAQSQNVCFFGSWQQFGVVLSDFTIDGLGFNNPTNMSGTTLLMIQPSGQAKDIQILNFAGATAANDTALFAGGFLGDATQVTNFQSYAGGVNCISGLNPFEVTDSSCDDLGIDLNANAGTGIVSSKGNNFQSSSALGATCLTQISNGTLSSSGDRFSTSGNSRSDLCLTSTGPSRANLLGDTLSGGTFNAGFGGNIFFNNTATETVYAAGTTFTATGAGSGFSTNGTGPNTFIDGCGNSFSTTPTFTNVNYVPCWQGAASSATPLTLTGTGACSTRTTQTGTGWKGTITCTAATAASTLVITPGVNANVPVQGGTGWQCSGSDVTTVADTLTQSAQNATTCTLNATSITANDVIVFQVSPF